MFNITLDRKPRSLLRHIEVSWLDVLQKLDSDLRAVATPEGVEGMLGLKFHAV